MFWEFLENLASVTIILLIACAAAFGVIACGMLGHWLTGAPIGAMIFAGVGLVVGLALFITIVD
jgi:uncharacterized protein YacL